MHEKEIDNILQKTYNKKIIYQLNRLMDLNND